MIEASSSRNVLPLVDEEGVEGAGAPKLTMQVQVGDDHA